MSARLEEHKKRQRERRLATCKHFTGIMNDTCGVGVVYRSVRDVSGPGMAKWPCTGGDCATVCDKRQLQTPEEVDAQEREFHERISHLLPARAAIIATKKQNGAVDCPRCGAKLGLGFSVARSNGHVHAACITKDCLSWME